MERSPRPRLCAAFAHNWVAVPSDAWKIHRADKTSREDGGNEYFCFGQTIPTGGYNRAMSQAVNSVVSETRQFEREPGPQRLPRPLLLALAFVFAALTVLYSALWMYYIRLQTRVELGIESEYSLATKSLLTIRVQPGSPAEKSGLKAGDKIVAIDGQSIEQGGELLRAKIWIAHKPGDAVSLLVQRPGQAQPLHLTAVFRANANAGGLLKGIAEQVVGSYPLIFLAVGLTVLFMRLDDRNAWILALLFAAFIAASDLPPAMAMQLAEPVFQKFMLVYRSIMLSLIAPLLFFFFAVFPERSPIERRVPWLKWVLFLPGIFFAISGMEVGGPSLPAKLAHWIPEGERRIPQVFVYGTAMLALISLVMNAMAAPTPEAKRKIRVILWGTLVGVGPGLVVRGISDFGRWQVPFWLDFFNIVTLILFPLSFAYAVVRHRVLEIPVLLRRSARYLLVKHGFVVFVLLLALVLNISAAISLSRMFHMQPALAMSLGTGFGILLAWSSAPTLRRGTERIDRAFFRGAYDARKVLQDLAQRVRSVNSKEDLATVLHEHLQVALHPSSLAIYLKNSGDSLQAALLQQPGPQEIPLHFPELDGDFSRGEPVEITPRLAHSPVISGLAALHPDCIAPVLGRSGALMGLFVLGMRLSEEPYSSEDKLLLGSVASQAGVALENIRLAETMAERMEMDRRTAREMQIAREVQKKLLPQETPALQSLDYCGACVQARAVGGDYYDFLDLGSGRVGLVLADIAGKGISGALLMANLQASLRSQYALAGEDLSRLLVAVNRLFYKNTESNHYATMFFGLYDDSTRKFSYVNCGHNAPLLLRSGNTVERLEATATVMGLFEEWNCAVAEVQLAFGDILALYTDGITEATNPEGEEFGEERLLNLLRTNCDLPAADLLKKVLNEVQQFSPGEQGDDLTLIVAKVS